MRILITGGAGFIGSNLAEALLADKRVSGVIVFDNLATGSIKNIDQFLSHPGFTFIEEEAAPANFIEKILGLFDIRKFFRKKRKKR